MKGGRCQIIAGTALSGVAGALCLALGSSNVYALPEGGVVAGGDIAIKRLDETQLRVEQRSAKGIVNWQSFDIDLGEHTHFQQPSSSSVTLNRVTGSEQRASQIMGTLTATGKVALVNPNGIVFGKDATVDVSGLVASTADIADRDFLNGKGTFNKPGHRDASVINEGTITARAAGMAALVAPHVRNSGTITARLGRVNLAGAETHVLSFAADDSLTLGVDDATLATLVENDGLVTASGGQVTLTAAAAENVLGGLVSSKGTVDVSSSSGKGGTVTITAPRVQVSGAINADGRSGGGKVFVGGDYLGGKGEKQYSPKPVKTAKQVYLTDTAAITASATGTGKGGTAIVWSDEYTYFGGRIEAKGGYLGGDGGFIETSSHDNLQAFGLADASAPKGKAGTWLLDPRNVTITSSTSGGSFGGGNPNTFTPTADSATVLNTTINTALNGGTSVIITTGSTGTQAGNITVASPISKTAGGDATLTLQAANNIQVNAGILSSSNKLNVNLYSDSDGSNSGMVQVNGVAITTNGGNFTASGGTDPLNTTFAWGNATDIDGVSIQSGASISTGAGNILVRGHGRNNAGANNQWGIDLDCDAVSPCALSTTTGNMTLVGVGGNGVANNHGIGLVDITLTSSSGAINLSGTGGVAASGNYNDGISFLSGAHVTTTSGNITLSGTGGGSGASSSENKGLYLEGDGVALDSMTIVSNSGAIALAGSGGAGHGQYQFGIQIGTGARIKSTGIATINLTGVGGGNAGSAFVGEENAGIYINGSSVTGTGITSVDGAITLNGTGGLGASLDYQSGIDLSSGTVISATGNGTITLTGTGTAGKYANVGTWIGGTGTEIISANGAINLSGIGGSSTTADEHIGIYVYNSARIRSTGTGSITLNGTGGTGGGGFNVGMHVNNAEIAAVSEAITLNGTGGTSSLANSWDHGVSFDNGGKVHTTGSGFVTITAVASDGLSPEFQTNAAANLLGDPSMTGNITLNANTVELGAGTLLRTQGNITVKPRTVSTTIGLGNSATGTLNLDAAELGYFSADGLFTIGDAAAGTGAVNLRAWNWSAKSHDVLVAGGNITLAGALNGGSNDFSLISRTAGGFTQGANAITAQNITLTANALSLGAALTAHATTGNITLKPFAVGTTVGLGGGTGTLNLTDTELGYLVGGGLLTIGDLSLGTGAVAITSWDYSGKSFDVTVVGGATTISGGVTGGSNHFTSIARTGNLTVNASSPISAQDITLTSSAGNVATSSNLMGSGHITLTAGGGNVTQNTTSVISTSVAGKNIVLQASGGVISYANLTSQGGYIRLLSDSDGSNDGGVYVQNTTITTNGGDFVASGGVDPLNTTYAWGGGSTEDGVYLTGASGVHINTGTGNVLLRGRGLNLAAGDFQTGITMENSSSITTTSGAITLAGIGGNGTIYNYGINLSNASLTTASGAISLSGTGGLGATGDENMGIAVYGSSINSTTTGAVSLTGRGGGTGTGGVNYGINLSGHTINTVNGAIVMTGTGGGGSGDYHRGIDVQAGTISGTGTATITLTGTGGGTGAGGGAHGVSLEYGGTISSVNGDITLNGTSSSVATGGANAIEIWDGYSVLSTGSASIIFNSVLGQGGDGSFKADGSGTFTVGGASMTGNITLNIDSLELAVPSSIRTTGNILVKPRTVSTSIGLGGASGTLNLDDTELSYFNADGTFTIGDLSLGTGAVAITSWDDSGKSHDVVVVGGATTITGGLTGGANHFTSIARSGNLMVNASSPISAQDITLTSSAGNVTTSSNLTGTGHITLTAGGGNVTQNSTSVISTSGASRNILLRASANVITNANLTSQGGYIRLLSDSDGSNDGMVQVNASSITTNGGDFVASGGTDALNTTYAWGSATDTDGVSILSNASISTGAGNILMRGRGRNNVGTSYLYGIALDSSALTTSSGNITLVGTGGNGLNNNYGIVLGNAQFITGSGVVSLTGAGGLAATGMNNYGVFLDAGGTLDSTHITTASGAIIVTGTGGGGTNSNSGVIVYHGARLRSTGSGTITVNGTAGGTGNVNFGVVIDGSGGAMPQTGITSLNGAITLSGFGGTTATGYNSKGIILYGGARIAGTGTASISLTGRGGTAATGDYNEGMTFFDGSHIVSASGNITLLGTGGGTSVSSDYNAGIILYGDNATLDTTTISTTDGAISLSGTGGANNTDTWNLGVHIINGARLKSLGSGTISVDGTGGGNGAGGGTGVENAGIYITGGSVIGTGITSLNGNISLNGRGGVSAQGGNNYGVNLISGAVISSTGSAAITVTGAGSGSTGGFSPGIVLQHSGSEIASASGAISLIGTGGSGTSDMQGILILDDAKVRATGNATITMTGTGGSATSWTEGIAIATAAEVSSVNGAITLNGTGGTSLDGYANGVELWNGGILKSIGSGTITVTGVAGASGPDFLANAAANILGDAIMTGNIILDANTVDLAAGTVIRTQGNITVKPRTASTTIGLGGGAGTLNLDDTELSYFSADGMFTIGDLVAGTGALALTSWDFSGKNHDVVVVGGATTIAGGVTGGSNHFTSIARTGSLTVNASSPISSQDITLTSSTGGVLINSSLIASGHVTATANAGNVNLNGAVSTSTAARNIVLRASGNVTSSANITSQGGDIHLLSDSDGSNDGMISVTGVSISTNGGNFVASGGLDPLNTTYAWGNTTDDDGITLGGTNAINTGAGSILLRGHGRNSAANGRQGIESNGTSTQFTTTSGNMTMAGVGGNGVASNYGVWLRNTQLTTVSGLIALSGTGGLGSTGNLNHGIYLDSGTHLATSTSNITLTGTGGGTGATSDYNDGVRLHGGSILDGTDVVTGSGSIILTGQGSVTGDDDNNGAAILAGARLRSTGSGTITVNGTGGGTDASNSGIVINGGGLLQTGIAAVNGAVTITGQGSLTATGGSNTGIQFYAGGAVASMGSAPIILTGIASSASRDMTFSVNSFTIGDNAMTGDITLNADTIDLTSATTIRTLSNILVKPRTASTSVGLGGGAGTLNLDDTELSYFNADGTFTIGDTVAGTGALATTSWDYSGKNHDVVVAGGVTTIAGGVTGGSNHFTAIARSGDLNVNATSPISAGDITLTSSAGNVTTSSNLTGTGHITLTAGGGNVTQNSTSAISTLGSPRNIVLRASNNVLSYANLTSQGGHIHLLSDSDGSNAGAIHVVNAAITTNGGDFVASGGISPFVTGYAWGTGAQALGVFLNNADITTGAGHILVRGHGLNVGGAGSGQTGIYMVNGSAFSTTSGNITFNGMGGNGSGGSNVGVGLYHGGTLLSSATGIISVTGQGGDGTGAYSSSHGIHLWGGAGITSTGAAAMTLSGVGGGSGSGGHSTGILVDGGTVSSSIAPITLVGIGGGGTGDFNRGIMITNGGSVSSTGTAAIVLSGTGGGTGSGSQNSGLDLGDNSTITTTGGNITLSGTGGASTGTNVGIGLWNGMTIASTSGSITFNSVATGSPYTAFYSGGDNAARSFIIGGASMTGSITFNTDTMVLDDVAYPMPMSIQTTGNILVKPRTASTSIGLGGGAGTLNLDDTELGYFNADGTFTIGDLSLGTGAVTIDSYDYLAKSHDVTIAGGNIGYTGGINGGSNALSLLARTGSISKTSGDLAAGALSLATLAGSAGASGTRLTTQAASLALSITGGSAWLTEADGLSVAGSVGSALDLVAAGPLSLGALSVGSLLAQTTGAHDITLTGPVTASAAGNAIVLASSDDLHNSHGASVFSLTGGGRWLLYSERPDQDTKGSLTIPTKRYGKTYAAYGPGSVTETGNVWLYSHAPTLAITPTSQAYTYDGTAASFSTSAYAISGYIDGDTALTAISGGSAAVDAIDKVNAGTRTITSSGTLTSTLGYLFSYDTLTNGLVIGQRALTIAVNGASKTYGDVNPSFSFASFGGSLVARDSIADVTGGTGAAGDVSYTLATPVGVSSNVGTYTNEIGISGASLDGSRAGNYAITIDNGDFLISQRTLTIAVNGASKTYGDSNPSFSFASFSGSLVAGDSIADVTGGTGMAGDVSYTLATPVGTNSSVGMYTNEIGIAGASLDGGRASNYAITINNGDFTISQRALTIAINGASKTYGDANPSFSFASFSGSLVAGDSIADVTGGSGVAGDVTYTLATPVGTNSSVGTYTNEIGISGASLDGSRAGNYAITVDNGDFTISQRALMIAVNNASKIYGDANPAFSFASFGGSLVAGDSIADVTGGTGAASDVTYTLATPVGVSANAGTYSNEIGINYASLDGTRASNYAITMDAGDFTVGKRPLTLTPGAQSYTYNGTAGSFNTAAPYTLAGCVLGDDCSAPAGLAGWAGGVTLDASDKVNAGIRDITSSGSLAATNYSFIYGIATNGLTLGKAVLSILPTAQSYSFINSASPFNSAAYTLTGFAGSDTAAVVSGSTSVTASDNVNVGTRDITASGIGTLSAANYTFSAGTLSGGLTITPATLVITPTAQSYTYNGTASLFNTSSAFSVSGCIVGDDCTTPIGLTGWSGSVSLSAADLVGAGVRNILSTGTISTSNYLVSYATLTNGLTISPAALTIVVNGAAKTYGGANPAFSFAGFSGSLAAGDTMADITGGTGHASDVTYILATPAGESSNAGTYTDEISIVGASLDGSKAGNYAITVDDGDLTVNKAMLTVIADNKSKIHGDANPALTLRYTGFVDGDTATDLDTGPTASTVALASSQAGDYVITITDGVDNNYDFLYTDGILTINALPTSATPPGQSQSVPLLPPVSLPHRRNDAVMVIEEIRKVCFYQYSGQTTYHKNDNGHPETRIDLKPRKFCY